MSDLTLILLAAGNSSRFNTPVKKQWLRIGYDPLWLYVTKRISDRFPELTIIIAAHKEEIPFMQSMCPYTVIEGGATRQQSLINALSHVVTPYVMVSDVARSCVEPDLILRLMAEKEKAESVVPVLEVVDTVVLDNQTIDRTKVRRIQTPQLSRTDFLLKALETDIEYTDESSAIVASGGRRVFVPGDSNAVKLTHVTDLSLLECLKGPAQATFTGNGFDVHPFEEGKPMVLGGVSIDSTFGFKAHSDGDVAIHALIDALLGAAGLGDIGQLFPDTDMQYKNIDSKVLLTECVSKLHRFGFVILHADLTIIAQVPRVGPYKEKIRTTLAQLLSIPACRMNVKATTTEHLGFIGRKEGVGVLATASVNYYDWKNG